jgi:hypothetical protein
LGPEASSVARLSLHKVCGLPYTYVLYKQDCACNRVNGLVLKNSIVKLYSLLLHPAH